MKKILVLVVALTLSFAGFSQSKINEGMLVITQKMTSDNEQMNAQISMMGDTKTTTYFKGEKSRTEVSSSMTGDVVVVADGESGEMITYMDNPMLGKKYMKGSVNDSQVDPSKVTVKKGDKTKTILGYKCQQYFLTAEVQGQTMEMELYTTEAINAYSQQTSAFSKELKGFPMYLTVNMSQMGMNITITSEVTKINKNAVAADKFSMVVPEGYEEMTQPEIKN
ncbi:hypothetical protein [Pontimicrobium aquaticum]|uniref:DUF4412 domain-containing protein n=1 Tax=Pontimicrobium aquaticum TaxID=2565367 RepID=A0A4U0EYX1_9FLAO|nr:hypothetical protein [Pontimicrobium aquaticum]TJY37246.1 hypothetical protein E5167_04665 [Pontimicrobium aquaticum]